ncbi:expressed unknown protein [Seminavis robusta]|uniref:SHSP domain-containing protein n=1 Tax=Seminavis robusta TaxID=568900 RepID=A0A9N8H2Z8_9STRA|nr:expressed unknown protein [Seminavis robusta]|eukprot:Sro47_g028010.1 n/a (311) ;mRNA; r:143860-144792
MPCSQRPFRHGHHGHRGHRGGFHPYMMMRGGFPHFHPFFMAANESAEEDSSPMSMFQKNKSTWNETEENYIFQMDVPGVKAHQITIEEKDGEVEVTAIRMNNKNEIEKTYQEILYVRPTTSDLANTVATLDNGVLTVIVPKKSNDPVNIETETTSPPEATDDKEFRISIDLPGVKAPDLKAHARQGKVYIEATRKIGDRVLKLHRTIETQDLASVDVAHARAFLQDGVFTLVVPSNQEEAMDSDEKKPAGMRTIWVTSEDEVPAALASLYLDDKDEELKEAMVVETVTEDDKEGWEQVNEDTKKPAGKTD